MLIRWPLRVNYFVVGLLAQMSEFSFVLIEEASKNNILNTYHADFLVCLATLSLAVGSVLPLVIKALRDG